jgi:hypothetical protein
MEREKQPADNYWFDQRYMAEYYKHYGVLPPSTHQRSENQPLIVIQPPSLGTYVAGLLVRKLWRKHGNAKKGVPARPAS